MERNGYFRPGPGRTDPGETEEADLQGTKQKQVVPLLQAGARLRKGDIYMLLHNGDRITINTNGRLKWADGKTGTVKEIRPNAGYDIDRLYQDELVIIVDDMDRQKPPFGLVTVSEFEVVPITAKAETEGTKRTDDPVNHPSHYTDGKYECIDFIESQGYNKDGYLFNAVKYISRAGKKDPTKRKEDLEKAIWYLERKIEYETASSHPYIPIVEYVRDKGLEGTLPGLALRLIGAQNYSLAAETLRIELNTHEEHSS